MNESRDRQIELERDKLAAECRRLQVQCRDLKEAAELVRKENALLRLSHDSEVARGIELTQLNERLQRENRRAATVVQSPVDHRLASLWRNFPQSAKYLVGNSHQLDPTIPLTKDGRPDRRYTVGKRFCIFNNEVTYVLHEGRRVCLMLQTVREK